MFPVPRLHAFLSAALLWILGVSAASAQFLVYELRFAPEQESVNFSFYTGAYMIAPTQGGPATLVLTTEEGSSRVYAVSEAGGKFFVAANRYVRKAAFSAIATRGTAQAFYSISGHLNRSLLLDSPDRSRRSWRVAETLEGRLMAADDESAVGPAPDGSFGMIGNARIKAVLREDLTANASLLATNLTDATTYILELLEKYGYYPDSGETVTPAEEEEIVPPDSESVIDASLFPPEVRGQTTEP